MKKVFGKITTYIAGVLLWLMLSIRNSYGQSEWTTITPPNEFFSFDFPGEPNDVYNDSLINLLRYTYAVGDECIMQCILMKHDSSFKSYVQGIIAPDSLDISSAPDSLFNPLVNMRDIWEEICDSDSILLYQTYNLEDSTIKVMDLGMHIFIGSPNAGYFYIKAFYNGHDILAFIASSGESQYENLIAYKNQYFDSIVINP